MRDYGSLGPVVERAQYWRPRPDRFDGTEELRSYVGGMRSGVLANWNPPLVRLKVYPTGVQLGPAWKGLKVIVPFWQVGFEEMEVVESVGMGLLVSGIRFRTTDGGWRIFWTWGRGAVLELLGQLGVNIDATPRRFRPLDPSGDL